MEALRAVEFDLLRRDPRLAKACGPESERLNRNGEIEEGLSFLKERVHRTGAEERNRQQRNKAGKARDWTRRAGAAIYQ